MLLRIEHPRGRTSFAEAAPLPWFGTETVEEIEAACRRLGDTLPNPPDLPPNLGCLAGAVRAALRDLDTPALPESAPAYLTVAALLPAGPGALDRAKVLGEAGFRTFKWKVGVGDAAYERALLDDLLAVLPGGSRLRLDANGAWDRREAERWVACCAERPIEFLEQPVAPGLRGAEDILLGLAGDYPTPLALDESVATGSQIAHWLERGWPGVFVFKPSLVANPEESLQRLARANAPVVFSSALETAVAARAALQLAFRHADRNRALGFGVYPLYQDGRFDGPSAAPFVRREDVARLNPEDAWNALG